AVAAGDDGLFGIVRGVARDRVISTVDPQARHGHKSRNRRFDGYKAHTSVDPDSELIDEVTVTAANTPDRDAVDDLLAPSADEEDKPQVVGDSAYADGETRERLAQRGYAIRAKGPSVERKVAPLTRRVWGGRKARCRGLARIATDVDTRAAAVNLARLAALGVGFSRDGWTIATT